jgi:hypothetical protein
MPKIISKGKIIIDGKEYNREDFDDTRSGHTHLKEDGGFFGR